MLTGVLMPAAGCGCPAVPSSSSSSTATVQSALERELIHQETTSGRPTTCIYNVTSLEFPSCLYVIRLDVVLNANTFDFIFLQALYPHLKRLPKPLHLRTLERPRVGPEGSQLCGGSGLSQTDDQPC